MFDTFAEIVRAQQVTRPPHQKLVVECFRQ
jgi:hypothetical protein